MTAAVLPRESSASEAFRSLVHGKSRGLKETLLRGGLQLLSLPYGLGVSIRNRLYDAQWLRQHRVEVPVVSIGNLTLGGTGKTPAVEYVARFYRESEHRVVILSRGYGSSSGQNDEALMLEENLPDVPHLQGKDRAELAAIAIEELECEVLVLDDGFQHRRLHRDLDIVLLDATDPWGGGWLFPGGLLRESARSLRRAHLIVLTRCDQVAPEALASLRAEVERLAPGVPLVESIHTPVSLTNRWHDHATVLPHGGTPGEGELSLGALQNRPLIAFCGIGNPEAFHRTLTTCGGIVMAFEAFPDHHAYTRTDVDRLRAWARQYPADALVVTTQKDLVKLRLGQLGGRPLWALQIALQPTQGQEEFDRQLKGVLA